MKKMALKLQLVEAQMIHKSTVFLLLKSHNILNAL